MMNEAHVLMVMKMTMTMTIINWRRKNNGSPHRNPRATVPRTTEKLPESGRLRRGGNASRSEVGRLLERARRRDGGRLTNLHRACFHDRVERTGVGSLEPICRSTFAGPVAFNVIDREDQTQEEMRRGPQRRSAGTDAKSPASCLPAPVTSALHFSCSIETASAVGPFRAFGVSVNAWRKTAHRKNAESALCPCEAPHQAARNCEGQVRGCKLFPSLLGEHIHREDSRSESEARCPT